MKLYPIAVGILFLAVQGCKQPEQKSIRSELNQVKEETKDVSSYAIELAVSYEDLIENMVPEHPVNELSYVHGTELAKQLAKEKFDFLNQKEFVQLLQRIHHGALQIPALDSCKLEMRDIAKRNGKKLEELAGQDKKRAQEILAFISYEVLVKTPALSNIQWAEFAKGVKDQWGKSKTIVAKQKLTNYYENKVHFNKRINDSFLVENAKLKGVITTESGLQYKVLKEGDSNIKPTATDEVEVHYHGVLLDGSVFDSSFRRGKTAHFIVGQVVPGWVEGLQLMSVGSKYRFYIPYDLGYGPRGREPKIPSFSLMVFDVELKGVSGK